eukprot:753917-Hanusia_phi.AAC.2
MQADRQQKNRCKNDSLGLEGTRQVVDDESPARNDQVRAKLRQCVWKESENRSTHVTVASDSDELAVAESLTTRARESTWFV